MSRSSRYAHTLLVVGALASAVPAVRWCPLRWDQVLPSAFLRCAAAAGVGDPRCALSFDGGRATAARCDACPLEAGTTACDEAPPSSCPFATGLPPDDHSQPGSPSRRAYLLGDAAYTRAVRRAALQIEAPGPIAGLFAARVAFDPPAPICSLGAPVCDSDPPAARAESPPPARAPPRTIA